MLYLIEFCVSSILLVYPVCFLVFLLHWPCSSITVYRCSLPHLLSSPVDCRQCHFSRLNSLSPSPARTSPCCVLAAPPVSTQILYLLSSSLLSPPHHLDPFSPPSHSLQTEDLFPLASVMHPHPSLCYFGLGHGNQPDYFSIIIWFLVI